MSHTPAPWVVTKAGLIETADNWMWVTHHSYRMRDFDATHIVKCVNAHDELVTAAKAALAYDPAIQGCANDPDKMSSHCTADGDDLDTLYAAWISASRAALAKVRP